MGVKGASGTGIECGEGLTVHATKYCEGSDCAEGDAGTCCQQKCNKGWKVTGAKTDESNTCPKATTVSSDGKCEGNPCRSEDDKTCCNVKCTDSTKGFKVKSSGKSSSTAKETTKLECKTGQVISSKGMCKGACKTDDATTCCSGGNGSSTTDANSVGLATAAAILVVLSVC